MLVKLIMKVLSNLLGNGSKIKYTEIGVQKDNEILNIKEYVDSGEVYSTNEVKTNKVWINGKPIYRKIFNFGTLPNTDQKYMNLNISNLEFVTHLEGIGYESSTQNYWMIPNVASSGLQFVVDLAIINNTQIRIRTGSDRSTYSAYVTVEYTKTTD